MKHQLYTGVSNLPVGLASREILIEQNIIIKTRVNTLVHSYSLLGDDAGFARILSSLL
jgi:hypothetical protein